jgi:C-terminal processing protease CtpA/Prc
MKWTILIAGIVFCTFSIAASPALAGTSQVSQADNQAQLEKAEQNLKAARKRLVKAEHARAKARRKRVQARTERVRARARRAEAKQHREGADTRRAMAKRREKLAEARAELQKAAAQVAALSTGIVGDELTHTLKHAHISLGWSRLGLTLGAAREDGRAVEAVTPGSAADQAGIEAGDTVKSIAGVKLDGAKQARSNLERVLAALEPGKKVEVVWTHAGATHHAMLKARDLFAPVGRWVGAVTANALGGLLAAANENPDHLHFTFHMNTPGSGNGDDGDFELHMFSPTRWQDMELATLTPQLGAYFGTNKGLLVVRAPKNDALKLDDGDVILKIGSRTPANPTQAMRILRSYIPGDTVKLTVMRDQDRQELTVKLPKKGSSRNDD